jgi:hypothetical protein
LIASNQLDGFLPYPYTTLEVITMVNDALASGDSDTMLAVASLLDDTNNGGSEYFNWYWIKP